MTRPAVRRPLPALIFCATLAVFLAALPGLFLDWDDFVNLVANPHYRGLGWAQIRWMFTATLMGHCIPLTPARWSRRRRLSRAISGECRKSMKR